MAAKNVKMRFIGRQPDRFVEILERGFGAARLSEMDLAAVLPRLPETGIQLKSFFQERERTLVGPNRRRSESLVEHCRRVERLWLAIPPYEIEIRSREQAETGQIECAVESPGAERKLARQREAREDYRQRQRGPGPLASP